MDNENHPNLLPDCDANATVSEFDLFWRACPLRVGKLYAKKCYAKARKIASHEEIMAGLEMYKRHKPDDRDWLHPSTFLNQGRWMDEYETSITIPMREVTEAEYRVKLREEDSKFANAEIPDYHRSNGRYMVPEDWRPQLKSVEAR